MGDKKDEGSGTSTRESLAGVAQPQSEPGLRALPRSGESLIAQRANLFSRLRQLLIRRTGRSSMGELPYMSGAPIEPASIEISSQEGIAEEVLKELLMTQLEVATSSEVRERIGETPVILVINRSILSLEIEGDGLAVLRPPGGAAAASYDALRHAGGGVVVATATTDLEKRIARSGLLVSPGHNVWIHYLFVEERVFNLFYNEFANPALWLIQHEMGDKILPRPRPRDWLRHPRTWISHYLPWVRVHTIHRIIFSEAVEYAYKEGYQRVNQQYAEALMTAYGDLVGVTIMIQDYHFYLLPQYLRDMRCKALLHYFVHIPWPSHQYLQRVLPETLRRELIASLLRSDLLGFQTTGYCRAFMTAARTLLRAEVDFANGLVTYEDHVTLVQDYPISVDVGQLRRTALAGETGAATLGYVQGLRRKVGRRVLVVRADRVDLSKGIGEGFKALDLMLRRDPSLRGQVMMLALLQRSRLNVPEYRNLFEETKSLVRELNAKWAPESTWDGIIDHPSQREAYLRDLEDPTIREWPLVVVDFTDKPNIEVVGAQVAADVGLVNPLADGMNLVVKEFAVNNKPSFIRDFNQRLRHSSPDAAGVIPAVIIGSTRMGAFQELKDGLLSVDPRSIPETADVLLRAIRLQLETRGLAGGRSFADRLPGPVRRIWHRPLLPEVLADRAAEQVSRNTITDWMDKILLDLELRNDPLWWPAVKAHGIRSARGAIERGHTLEDAFPDIA
jgi:trehalose 6-phosphate synthase